MRKKGEQYSSCSPRSSSSTRVRLLFKGFSFLMGVLTKKHAEAAAFAHAVARKSKDDMSLEIKPRRIEILPSQNLENLQCFLTHPRAPAVEPTYTSVWSIFDDDTTTSCYCEADLKSSSVSSERKKALVSCQPHLDSHNSGCRATSPEQVSRKETFLCIYPQYIKFN